MYGIKLFENIYSEAEIVAFDSGYVELLKDLLDDKMSVRVLEFFDAFDKSPAATDDNAFAEMLRTKVAMMKEILYPTARQLTFHIHVKERNLIERLRNLTVQTLKDKLTGNEFTQTLEDINWLLENNSLWIAEIKPRNNESFKRLIAKTPELVKEAIYFKDLFEGHGFENIEMSNELKQRILANKILFYVPREQVRKTHMGILIQHRSEIELIQHALVYMKRCDELNMGTIQRRLPTGGTSR